MGGGGGRGGAGFNVMFTCISYIVRSYFDEHYYHEMPKWNYEFIFRQQD